MIINKDMNKNGANPTPQVVAQPAQSQTAQPAQQAQQAAPMEVQPLQLEQPQQAPEPPKKKGNWGGKRAGAGTEIF